MLGALVNAVFLVALCFSITVEACKRFIEVEEIHDPQLLVIVGGLGLVVNVIGLFLFHGECEEEIAAERGREIFEELTWSGKQEGAMGIFVLVDLSRVPRSPVLFSWIW